MFRMLTSFRAVALFAVLALSISGAALAGSATLIVGRDSRVCLAPIYATQSVDAQGTANPGVRFTVHRSPNNGIYSDLYQTGRCWSKASAPCSAGRCAAPITAR